MIEINSHDVLLIVDPQNDFMPGGALPVPGGDRIFSFLNPLTGQFNFVVASQDWHPKNHISFQGRGGPWPPHCVQGTWGAQFHPALDQSHIGLIVRKGFNPDKEQYSCFDQTNLAEMLKARGSKRIFVGGVATDYCVLASVLGALEGGLETYVLTDCIQAVNVKSDDGEKALTKMRESGAKLIVSSEEF